MNKLTMQELLARMEHSRRFLENVRAMRHLPASPGTSVPFPSWIHPRLRTVLERGGD